MGFIARLIRRVARRPAAPRLRLMGTAARHPELRRLRLRYPGTCVVCGAPLAKGTEALYQRANGSVRCLACPAGQTEVPGILAATGVAGRSAEHEHERRRATREARVKARLGDRLGRVVLAVTGEPLSTRAWRVGAQGEITLAAALAAVPDIRLLHDRRVAGTRGNIDHLVVGPAGVFVVDAKHYVGLIRIRDRGGLFHTDERLYIGRRDCSELADHMAWQVEAVERALLAADLDIVPRVVAVLCFVDGEWPLFRRPAVFRGVRLEGTKSIVRLVTDGRLLAAAAIDNLAGILAAALPAK